MYKMQTYGLCWCLPGWLFLWRWKYACHSPYECIDCGVCEPECPIDAIHSDTDEGMEKWAELNRKYSEMWPVITEKKEPPHDAKKWENVENKFQNHFSEKPGS